MIVLRLAAVLCLLALVVALALFVFTRDRRYLTWLSRIAQFALVFLLVVLVLYVLERLVLAV